jgi:hypothetical protein
MFSEDCPLGNLPDFRRFFHFTDLTVSDFNTTIVCEIPDAVQDDLTGTRQDCCLTVPPLPVCGWTAKPL